jgi:site-specific recombinase XerD
MKQHIAGVSLQDLVDGLIFSLQAEGRSVRTIEYYKNLLSTFLNYTNDNNLSDVKSINAIDIRQFLSWVGSRTCEYEIGNGTKRVSQAKPSTAFPYFRALRRLFNWAIQEGYIVISPLVNIHFKPPKASIIEGYSREELQHLLEVCNLDVNTGARFTGIRNKAMLLLFIDSGLRRAEMVNLTINDLDMDNRIVHVIGKGNKPGIAPFSSKTAKALWNWLIMRRNRAKTNHLWITEEGQGFSVEGLVSWFARLKSRGGISSPGGVHRLRHTAALQYLRGAKDSFKLQLFLRHSSLEMSRRYTQGLKQEEAIEAHRNGASPVEGLGLG